MPVFVAVVLTLQVVNVAYVAQSWIYILGVIFQLFLAFSAFVALLLDSWRE